MGLGDYLQDGQTPIAEEEKLGLRIKFITVLSELDEFEMRNISKAKIWLKRRRYTAKDVLNESYIRKLHERMFSDVWKWAGKFRQTEKNIGVSWVMVARELKVLCDDALFWVENDTFPPQEIALRFKHRLVSIHCFPNGNGRHSRMMADVLMENVFGLKSFTWGANLAKATDERKLYIEALKAADNGDLTALIAFAV